MDVHLHALPSGKSDWQRRRRADGERGVRTAEICYLHRRSAGVLDRDALGGAGPNLQVSEID